jgi:hypothetical protein
MTAPESSGFEPAAQARGLLGALACAAGSNPLLQKRWDATSRNTERFPEDFAYQLTQQEFMSLISQIAISKPGRGGRRTPPWVFTEQGVAMLSSVLRSPTAVRVNIEIMRAFVRLRRLMATPGELVQQLTKLAETVQLHDHQIKVISEVIQRMIEQPTAPRRQIGFHARST